uniref:Uncharacterized protein n=1 Tax=Megaselia scalaris TaxID=36166 RepID=T1GFY5_MEGSC
VLKNSQELSSTYFFSFDNSKFAVGKLFSLTILIETSSLVKLAVYIIPKIRIPTVIHKLVGLNTFCVDKTWGLKPEINYSKEETEHRSALSTFGYIRCHLDNSYGNFGGQAKFISSRPLHTP